MPTKSQSLSTAADRLYDLVRESKEISFRDAAEKLNIPVSTIEAWANFLEEDNLLAIKYKLTTPYLILPVVKSRKKGQSSLRSEDEPFMQKVEEAELRSHLDKIQELLESASDRISHGEFGMLEHIQNETLEKLRKVVVFIMRSVHTSPQKKADLNDHAVAIEKRIRYATEALKQKKFDEASRAYADSHARMKELLKKAQTHFAEEDEQSADEESIKRLFKKTYELLDRGKTDEAEEMYRKIERAFSTLSKRFSTERLDLQDSIVKLNRDLTIKVSNIRTHQIINGELAISKLIKMANESMKQKKFDSATAYYREIKSIFSSLPIGFTKEKRKMKEDILRVFEKIAKEREIKLKAKFDTIVEQIIELLEDSNKALTALNLKLAISNYKQIEGLFLSLPSGFMKEKLYLHTKIVVFYNMLAQNFESTAERAMNNDTARIMQLLAIMKRQIYANNLSAAADSYVKLNDVFSKLPRGFLAKKTDIQEKIIDVYEEFLEKKDNVKTYKFHTTVSDIEQMLNQAVPIVNSRDYAKAYAMYKRIKGAYIRLQPIDVVQRQLIRNKILILYRSIFMLKNRQEESFIKLPQLRSVEQDVSEKIEELKLKSKAKVKLPPQ